MAEVESLLTHDSLTYAATIVTINSTELGREDHGVWHTRLTVKWDGAGTGIGGYVLDGKPTTPGGDRPPTVFGMLWIIKTVETICGDYGKWEDLKGKRCFMLHEPSEGRYNRAGYNCLGLASLDGKRVMIFSDVVSKAADLTLNERD